MAKMIAQSSLAPQSCPKPKVLSLFVLYEPSDLLAKSLVRNGPTDAQMAAAGMVSHDRVLFTDVGELLAPGGARIIRPEDGPHYR